jgi:hypothetical protein
MSPTVKQKTEEEVEPGAGQALFMTDDQDGEEPDVDAPEDARAGESG